EDVSRRNRGLRLEIRVNASANLNDLAGKVHRRTAAIDGDHPDASPGECVEIENLTGDGRLGVPGDQKPSVRQDENMRIEGKKERRIAKLTPRIRGRIHGRIVDLLNLNIALVTICFPGSHDHSSIREHGRSGVPPLKRHVWQSRPRFLRRIKYV